jgi:hypothetical protein
VDTDAFEMTPMLTLLAYLHALLPGCPALPCNSAHASLQAH